MAMKDQDKYYTPELEEFHWKFEYESTMAMGIDTKKFYRKTLGTADLCEIYGEIANKTIRVKYLDRQDIEECGFEYDAPGNFHKDDLVLLYFNQETKSRGFCLFINDYGNNPDGLLYTPIISANIKNKSELKKLLEQLNINTK
jgi:hypothetical protein